MCNLISKFVLFTMLIMVTQPTFAQLYEVPLDQRIDQSEVIVEGEVISSKEFRGSDDNIYTSHRVAVSCIFRSKVYHLFRSKVYHLFRSKVYHFRDELMA
jgi:hypothetical protein